MRCVVHIDMDCFYAQVEALRLGPDADSRPIGVRQRGLLVTCDYAARARGVRKCVPVADALRVCPELLVVPGEDLRPYRRASDRVHATLAEFGCPIERLGLDEHFVDATDAVRARAGGEDAAAARACGCPAGAHDAIAGGARLAAEMRAEVRARTGLACCAGVAHNKTVAKLVGALRKPDSQTAVYPCEAEAFVSCVGSVARLPGVGPKTRAALARLGVESVAELQACPTSVVRAALGKELADRLKRLSVGVDEAPVVASRPSPVVGVEESCAGVGAVDEVELRLAALLRRLVALVGEGARVPGGVRVTVRRADAARGGSTRLSRQAKLSPSLFRVVDGSPRLVDGAAERIGRTAMSLLRDAVDLSRPFRLTLLGLAFTKLRDARPGARALPLYFGRDLCVHSMIDIASDARSEPASTGRSSRADPSCDADADVEPSPKKMKPDDADRRDVNGAIAMDTDARTDPRD